MSANDYQVGGSHYRAEFQHWDYTIRVLQNRYLEGQVTRYVTRWRKKNGLQDLEKALQYVVKLKEEFEAERVSPIELCLDRSILERYVEANELRKDEWRVIELVSTWVDVWELNEVKFKIEEMINGSRKEPQRGE